MYYLEFLQKFYVANKRYEPGFYKVEYTHPKGVPVSTMYAADRIWVEEDDKVIYFKHQALHDDVKVDMKEFTWIKLKAYELPRQF